MIVPALARNQASSCANPALDLFTQVNGVLVDVAVLEFQIFDVSDPGKQQNPVQVYPTSLGARAEYTLAGLMDRCATAMGSRQLRRWLNRPIRDHAELKRRQQAIDVLQRSGPIEPLQAVLKDIGDLERILTRIGLRSARPRDLTGLRDSLAQLPELRRLAAPLAAERQRQAERCRGTG